MQGALGMRITLSAVEAKGGPFLSHLFLYEAGHQSCHLTEGKQSGSLEVCDLEFPASSDFVGQAVSLEG